MSIQTLLIDNYDSFTFNLFQFIAEANGTPPIVVRNDSAPWSEVRRLGFDNIVVSPGPGRPENPRDFGICSEAILESDVPVLGVCLGHQGLCHLFGGEVDYAAEPMHGRPSEVHHYGRNIFRGIPNPFSAIRYHSLLVAKLSDQLEKCAWTADDIIMGVRHRERPIWGLQFHPESICTEFGQQLLENFRDLTEEALNGVENKPLSSKADAEEVERARESLNVMTSSRRGSCTPAGRGTIDGRQFEIHSRRLPFHVDAEQAFINNFAGAKHAFWLDSALVKGFSRFSYMGGFDGPPRCLHYL